VEEEVVRAMAELRLNVALEAIWKLVGRMNKYIDERAPWTLAREAAAGSEESAQALKLTLYTCLEATRIIAVLLCAFMPVACESIGKQLGLERPVSEIPWAGLAWGATRAGARVAPPQPIFPRIQNLTVDDAVLRGLASSSKAPVAAEREEEKLTAVSDDNSAGRPNTAPGTPVAPAPAPEESRPTITIDDFMKVDLRVADILAAEPVPNASKLLRLTVQVGDDDTRTILAGIAEYYRPEDLVGRQVVVVANLQPRKMRGIESQGMLLAADVDGKAILVLPDTQTPAGARVR